MAEILLPFRDQILNPEDACEGGGGGNVTGPTSSTTNAIAVFADETGELLLNSMATISPTGRLEVPSINTQGAISTNGGNITSGGGGVFGTNFDDNGNAIVSAQNFGTVSTDEAVIEALATGGQSLISLVNDEGDISIGMRPNSNDLFMSFASRDVSGSPFLRVSGDSNNATFSGLISSDGVLSNSVLTSFGGTVLAQASNFGSATQANVSATNVLTQPDSNSTLRATTVATGGDPSLFLSTADTDFSMGIDNDDSDILKLGFNDLVGTDTFMAINPADGIVDFTRTNAIILPRGTTAQRPTPSNAMVRVNTETSVPEWYNQDQSRWEPVSGNYSVEYLVIAGGGGGGSRFGGGGGIGGYQFGTLIISIGQVYSAIVGAGGAGGLGTGGTGTSGARNGVNGSNSVFDNIISIGGGGGARGDANVGVAGGGGGGGSGRFVSGGGNGTSQQGFSGGGSNGIAPFVGGGGGGRSGPGLGGGSGTGNGGNGLAWVDSVVRSGGGGGGADQSSTPGNGGTGGGGNGGRVGLLPTAGSPNTGSGGGGGAFLGATTPQNQAGAAGGSGVIILRYPGSQIGTGGIVTFVGGFTYHTFNSSSSYTG